MSLREHVTILSLVITAALLAAPADGQRTRREQELHDPLATVAAGLDRAATEVFAAFPGYDAARILSADEALAKRAGSEDASPQDGYVRAIAQLELLVIHRFYERNLPKEMPAVFAQIDPDDLARQGIALAEAFAAANPDHADVHRVRGELISFQIRGMVAGMTKGPEAKRAVNAALMPDQALFWVEKALAQAPGNPEAAYMRKSLVTVEEVER